MKDIFMINI